MAQVGQDEKINLAERESSTKFTSNTQEGIGRRNRVILEFAVQESPSSSYEIDGLSRIAKRSAAKR
jgi:hypothetical protein